MCVYKRTALLSDVFGTSHWSSAAVRLNFSGCYLLTSECIWYPVYMLSSEGKAVERDEVKSEASERKNRMQSISPFRVYMAKIK